MAIRFSTLLLTRSRASQGCAHLHRVATGLHGRHCIQGKRRRVSQLACSTIYAISGWTSDEFSYNFQHWFVLSIYFNYYLFYLFWEDWNWLTLTICSWVLGSLECHFRIQVRQMKFARLFPVDWISGSHDCEPFQNRTLSCKRKFTRRPVPWFFITLWFALSRPCTILDLLLEVLLFSRIEKSPPVFSSVWPTTIL